MIQKEIRQHPSGPGYHVVDKVQENRISVVGLGWLGLPLAKRLADEGYSVTGTKRNVGHESSIACGQVKVVKLDLKGGYSLHPIESSLFSADTLIITLPGSREAEKALRTFSDIRYLVDQAREAGSRHIIFTSSTSVYGDATGILTESSPVSAGTAGGAVMAETERWLLMQKDICIDIIRLAGLTGPGRHPARRLSGRKNLGQGEHSVNLVHQDDVITAIRLLIHSRGPGRLYNLCSPHHPSRREFYTRVCGLNDLPVPEFTAHLEREGGKIIDGSLICRKLGLKYSYLSLYDIPV